MLLKSLRLLSVGFDVESRGAVSGGVETGSRGGSEGRSGADSLGAAVVFLVIGGLLNTSMVRASGSLELDADSSRGS